MKILQGESELTKPTKYGYLMVEIDGSILYLSPENVKMRLFEEELKNKGWDVNDIDFCGNDDIIFGVISINV